jgi:Amt family ammonium transporter
MADYFTVVDLKTRSSGSVFSIATWAMGFFYSSFHLEENYGIRVKEEEIDGLDIHEHGTNVYND